MHRTQASQPLLKGFINHLFYGQPLFLCDELGLIQKGRTDGCIERICHINSEYDAMLYSVCLSLSRILKPTT